MSVRLAWLIFRYSWMCTDADGWASCYVVVCCGKLCETVQWLTRHVQHALRVLEFFGCAYSFLLRCLWVQFVHHASRTEFELRLSGIDFHLSSGVFAFQCYVYVANSQTDAEKFLFLKNYNGSLLGRNVCDSENQENGWKSRSAAACCSSLVLATAVCLPLQMYVIFQGIFRDVSCKPAHARIMQVDF